MLAACGSEPHALQNTPTNHQAVKAPLAAPKKLAPKAWVSIREQAPPIKQMVTNGPARPRPKPAGPARLNDEVHR